jgi:toxin FitB
LTRFLLDTNIISNVTKPSPSAHLLAWMAAQRDDDLCIASLTIAEIRRGILELPRGNKRKHLEDWFSGPDGPSALFAGRIFPFDFEAALVWAHIMAEGKTSGRPRSALDAIIAAIAIANDCIVVTDNEKDFAWTRTFNPLRASGG